MAPKKKGRIGQEANANDTSRVADDSLFDTVGEGSRPAITLFDFSIPEQTSPVPTPVEGTTIPRDDTTVPPSAPVSGSGISDGDLGELFRCSNPEEDPQDFIDEIHKTLGVMRATKTEGEELAAYRLKRVAYSWFELSEDSREERHPPARWSEFADDLLDHFMATETRAARATEFKNLKQGNKSVWEYHMEFARLFKYAIHMLPTMDARMVAFAQATKNYKLKNRMEKEGNSKARSTGNMKESLGGERSAFKGGSSGPSHSTLFYVTPFVSMEFGKEPEQLHKPFLVSTPVGESILATRVYRSFTVTMCGKDTRADLIELGMVDFDVIMGMDWLYSCFAKLDCRTRTMRLEFPNEPAI
ncbi:uncharacterized protein [Nicotiana sylvestris]|uniref:uncharacterized protein n=1 Tax=Nicotiana sylvestris TaxID=4096 RepID=UPI00388CE3BE